MFDDMGMKPASYIDKILCSLVPNPSLSKRLCDMITIRIEELEQEHAKRASQLRTLGERIKVLWEDLDIPSEEREAFSSSVHTLGEDTLAAGEQELERLQSLKNKDQIISASVRLQELLDLAVLSEDHYSRIVELLESTNTDDDVLYRLQTEVDLLEQQVQNTLPITKAIQARKLLVESRSRLDEIQRDPNRPRKISFRELREQEVLERKIKVELPKLNLALTKRIEQWEEQYQTVFICDDVPYLEHIKESELRWRQYQQELLLQRRAERRRSRPFERGLRSDYKDTSRNRTAPAPKRPSMTPSPTRRGKISSNSNSADLDLSPEDPDAMPNLDRENTNSPLDLDHSSF